MAETTTTTNKKYAVVTGANKGIGLEICRQLASKGITVVLTARDGKRGMEAVEKLIKEEAAAGGLSDHLVVFRQLDVTDKSSIASLADFIKNKFGRLDILVNNAGISGSVMDWDAYKSQMARGVVAKFEDFHTQNYDQAKECVDTNYYGAKWMIEALIPLLHLSDSPRIVNVASSMGKLKNLPTGWAKGVFSDAESLTEERVDEVLNKFLKDFKEGGSLETRGWPASLSAYIVSKAAINAYTRILAKKFPNFLINCVCPGYVKTDMNNHNGLLSVEEGAECPVKLALLPDDGPTGLFFVKGEVSSFDE